MLHRALARFAAFRPHVAHAQERRAIGWTDPQDGGGDRRSGRRSTVTRRFWPLSAIQNISGGPRKPPLRSAGGPDQPSLSDCLRSRSASSASRRKWIARSRHRRVIGARKSVVSGESVSVRVDLGGLRNNKKKK